MRQRKIPHSKCLPFQDKTIIIEGPLTPEQIIKLNMHPDLDAFRKPGDQHEALLQIAKLPEGRIIAALDGDCIVGYATFHYPDELERWSQAGMDDLIELGAIEIANEYRNLGLGKEIIQLAFLDGQLDDAIVFTTEYYWHWDLEGSGLDVWDYRKVMERLMKCVDMVWYATDDPEICSHPANCLMVRIGKNVPQSSVEQFDRIRFTRKFMY